VEAADRIGIMGAVVGQDREVNNLSYQHHILGQSYNDKFAYKFLHMGMNLPRNFPIHHGKIFPFLTEVLKEHLPHLKFLVNN
jgi:hypothetical protein